MLSRVAAKFWDSALALIAAVCAALWLTTDVVNLITTEVIAFFTIQAAIILPAMIFTAGLLKGQGLTLEEADRFQGALRRQMHFWVTLLFLDLVAVTLLIVGKASAWRFDVTAFGHTAKLGWTLMFVVTFVSTLAVLRMYPFVKGVMSLMELNGDLVRKSIEADEKKAAQPTATPMADDRPIDLPEGYGKIVPHPRKRRGQAKN